MDAARVAHSPPRLSLGCAFVISGKALVSGAFDSFDSDDGSSRLDFNTTPGILLCLAVVLVGFGLAVWARTGPLAAAGVAATVLGLPSSLFFVFFDGSGNSDPIQLTPILGISFVLWMLAYLAGPTRGHAVYLGGAAFAFWLFILEQIQDLPAAPFQSIAAQLNGDSGSSVDTGGLGAASLVIAILYLGLAGWLDHRTLRGSATPLLVAGLVAFVTASDLLSDDFGQLGTGLLIIAAGLLVAWLGARGERRFSTWLGGIWVVGGIGDAITDFVHDATTIGIVFIALGVVVVLLAQIAVIMLREPLETVDGPSRFTWRRAPVPVPAQAYYGGYQYQPPYPPQQYPAPGYEPQYPPPGYEQGYQPPYQP